MHKCVTNIVLRDEKASFDLPILFPVKQLFVAIATMVLSWLRFNVGYESDVALKICYAENNCDLLVEESRQL